MFAHTLEMMALMPHIQVIEFLWPCQLRPTVLSCLFAASFLFCSIAIAAPLGIPDDVAAFIRQQEEIRVYFPYDPDHTPGMGHQSATVHLMDRLVELGFKGKFTIVYDKGGEAFLERLIPGIDIAQRDFSSAALPIKDIIRYNDRSIDMRRGGKLSELPLGVTGGDDLRVYNRAKDLNTTVFLSFDPLDRREMNRVWIQERDRSIPLDHLVGQPYHYNVNRRAISHEVLNGAKEKIEAEGPARFVFLSYLVESLLDRSVDVLPFYESRVDRLDNLQNIAHGLKKALERRPELFSDVTIIPIFNRLDSDELRSLEEKFKEMSLGKGLWSKIATIFPGNSKVSFSLGTPEQFARGIPAAPNGHKAVYFVPVGSLPREVFEMFFVNSSMPPVFNGRNTANLMFNTGKPFLMTRASFRDRAKEEVDSSMGREAGGVVHRAYLDLGNTIPDRKTRGDGLSEFFIDVRSPNSKAVASFQAVASEYRNQANDRLVHGLSSVVEISRAIRLKRCEALF